MSSRAVLLAALLLLPQERPEDLVKRLRSDDIQERDEAGRKLLALGKAALPALRAAVNAWDAEMGGRAAAIVKHIETAEILTPALKSALPDAVDRVAAGQALAVLRDATATDELRHRRHPGIRGRDLDLLAGLALTTAQSDDERMEICNLVKFRGPLTGGTAARELIRCLKTGSPRVRDNAAHTLGCIGAREAIPTLIEAAESVGSAIPALANLQAVEAAEPILTALRRRNPDALHAAVALKLPGAESAIVELLDTDKDLGPLTEALADLRATRTLVELLRHKSTHVQQAALRALASYDPERTGQEADKLLQAGAPDTRVAAAYLATLDAARTAMTDEDFMVREASMLRYATLRGPAAADELLPFLDKPGPSVNLVMALDICNAKAAIPRLLKLLDSEELGRAARNALVSMGAPEVIPFILKDIGTAPQLVWGADTNEHFARELLQLGDAARKTLIAMASGENEYLRSLAVPLLGELGGADKDLLPRLADESEKVRIAAIRALAATSGDSVDALAKDESAAIRSAIAANTRHAETARRLLKDVDDDVRKEAAETLGRIGAKEAAGDLRGALKDTEPVVRREALRSLAAIAGRDAIPDAIACLEDPHWMTRRLAAEVLGDLDAREAAARLEKALADPALYVRVAAAEALAMLGSKAGVAFIIDDAEDFGGTVNLMMLNALRQPEAWRKGVKATVAAGQRGTWRWRIEHLASMAGATKVEFSPDVLPGRRWEQPITPGEPFWFTVRQELGNHELIIETGSWKVVTRNQALEFWKRHFSK